MCLKQMNAGHVRSFGVLFCLWQVLHGSHCKALQKNNATIQLNFGHLVTQQLNKMHAEQFGLVEK